MAKNPGFQPDEVCFSLEFAKYIDRKGSVLEDGFVI